MGFNYGYEKKKFDSRWKRLEVEYCDAGMSEEQIAAMKEYDWAWFCSQRVFQNHTQPIPCEQYDEVCGQSQLFRKFASLSYQWDVDKIDQTRYGWLASVENEQLLLRLKKLSKKDLELLTLLFVDGYRQIDVARLWHCSRSAVAQRFKKIKKFLFNVLEETLNPIRERRAVLQADIAAVMKVLEDGCVKANEKANATLKRAKDAMKINYFDDKDNITEYFK